MRKLNSRQFRQVWNFSISLRRFPPGCLWRVKSGSNQNSPLPPYLTLIPADQGHVQSHLSTQPEIPAIPYFPRIRYKCTSYVICHNLTKYTNVCQTISHRGNIGFKKLSETFNDENLSWILLEDFAPRSVIAWQIDAGNVIWVEYFQTTNNQLCTCLTWHTCQRVSAL